MSSHYCTVLRDGFWGSTNERGPTAALARLYDRTEERANIRDNFAKGGVRVGNIIGWIIYFAPTGIAWYRQREGQPIVGTVVMIGFINFFLGWTGIGWLLALANALGYNPVAQFAPKLAKFLVDNGFAQNPGQGAPPPNAPQGGPATPGQATCGQCGGSGTLPCSTCNGRGNWYEQPQLATGTAEHKSCGACTGSGRIRCH